MLLISEVRFTDVRLSKFNTVTLTDSDWRQIIQLLLFITLVFVVDNNNFVASHLQL